MLEQLPGEGPKTLGADKAYDTQTFVETLRAQEVTPHVAQNTARAGGSAIDAPRLKMSNVPRQLIG
jgi:hypothetical protein